jgi:hypothetical protein
VLRLLTTDDLAQWRGERLWKRFLAGELRANERAEPR